MIHFITITLDIKDSLEKKRSIFINKAIPNHPPVFRNWYLKEFPSPGEWLAILLNLHSKFCQFLIDLFFILGI